ncbi:penicillin-binding protein [Lentzea albida]|uniref:Membrane carboxypeptidase (Penicillin-binding protein) n=1 Tax=Lentzea albida TaxID=65499 RepID=A0A1H9MRK0_9PSEU|nr:penicillin-binding protein [Lentzea albida]SER25753.1 Membrane carboxypeptidase (penicillin-binding protein) [Lentzea albida]
MNRKRIGSGLGKLAGLCVLAGALVAGLLFPATATLGFVSNKISDQVQSTVAEMLNTGPPLMTTVTDKDGAPIAHLYDQYRVRTPPDKISQHMKDALLAIEDRRFYDHHGVDWLASLRALARNNASGSVQQGASTLTQQYVKNYLVHVVARNNKNAQREAQEQSITRKLREARIAIGLETALGKDEILRRYLDLVPFGSTIFGITAAAQAYFDTTPDKLTIPQAATLAGMVNSPTYLDPEARPDKAIERRNLVIDAMVHSEKLSKEEADRHKAVPLGLQDPVRPLQTGCVGAGPSYGFFCSFLVQHLVEKGFDLEELKVGGYRVETTLDPKITEHAKQAVEAQAPKTTPGVANTMAVVRPGKDAHEVVALVANRDYGLDKDKFETQFDLPSGVENKFGTGSVYKVFTAAAALEKGIGVDTVVDSPNTYTSRVFKGGAPSCPATGEPNTYWYCLSNHNDRYPPKMPLKQALATSPNTAFVILEEKVGLQAVVDMASKLGMRRTMATNIAGVPPDPKGAKDLRMTQAEFYASNGNASFTLGPAPSSTLELANVAATVMSGGTWCEPTPIRRVLDRDGKPVELAKSPCEQAVPEPLANALATGLSEDSKGQGTAAVSAKKAGWKRPMMGKTGTTEEYKSAAYLGATPDYAGAVQVFNDSTSPKGICVGAGAPTLCPEGNIYGGTVPAATWFDTMMKVHDGLPEKPLPQVEERFLKGDTQMKVPDVVGTELGKAKALLRDAGYEVTTVSVASDKPAGAVVDQSPRGMALRGTPVTLSVSNGSAPPPKPAAPPATTAAPAPPTPAVTPAEPGTPSPTPEPTSTVPGQPSPPTPGPTPSPTPGRSSSPAPEPTSPVPGRPSSPAPGQSSSPAPEPTSPAPGQTPTPTSGRSSFPSSKPPPPIPGPAPSPAPKESSPAPPPTS